MTSARDKRVALVTGAGTRVGRSIALELKGAGYNLAIHYQSNETGAREVAAEAQAQGLEAHVYQASLEDRGQIRRMLDSVLADFGGLDLLVPNAAIFERVRFEDIDDGAWDRMLGLNLTSTFALAHHAAASLKSRAGNIVFVTCSSVESPYKHHLPYVVAKAGVYQLMRTMALELAPSVRVNAVAPGTVLPPESMTAAELERLRSRIPLQRFGNPQDIAKAVRFLAESPFITGQQLVVDGGRSLAREQDGS